VSTSPPSVVLFACVHNAGRSQMAAAFFNALAHPGKARATSAGSRPGPAVHPEVLTTMREVGVELGDARPRHLDAALAEPVELLVTMGCGEVPVAGLAREDWPLDDPRGQPLARVREIREQIRAQVQALVDRRGWGR
jgi:arsenate reductase